MAKERSKMAKNVKKWQKIQNPRKMAQPLREGSQKMAKNGYPKSQKNHSSTPKKNHIYPFKTFT